VSADALIAEIRAMNNEEIAERLEFARTRSFAEIDQQQRREIRERAEAAARLQYRN
jgi:hypothetical protein